MALPVTERAFFRRKLSLGGAVAPALPARLKLGVETCYAPGPAFQQPVGGYVLRDQDRFSANPGRNHAAERKQKLK